MKNSLLKQLVTIVLLFIIALSGLILVSIHSHDEVVEIVKKRFNEQQMLVLKQTALGIEKNMELAVQELNFVSESLVAYDMNYEMIGASMNESFKHMRQYFVNDIGFIDSEGILRSNVKAPQLIGKDFSFRRYFQELKVSNEVYPVYEFITFKGADIGKKGIIIAIPFFINGSEFGGVLVATMKLDELLKGYLPKGKNKGEFWVVDTDDNILHHPRYDQGKINDNIGTNNIGPIVKLLESIKTQKTYEAEYLSPEGIKILASSYSVAIAGKTWFIISSVPEANVIKSLKPFSFKYFRRIILIFLVIGSASLIFIITIFRYNYHLKASYEKLRNETRERQKFEQALRESEERYRSLYTSMNEGVCLHEIVYDITGKAEDYIILDVNPTYERLSEISRNKAIGCKASELYNTDKPPYIDIYSKVADTGEPVSFNTFFPPMNKHFSISVFSPQKGQFATVFTDITERKRIEEKLTQYQDQLEGLVEERTLELQEANIQLQKEIVERKRAYEVTAVMEERERLARELHDSVTQSLYSLTLFAESGRYLAKKGDMDRLQDCLTELSNNAQGVLKELRLLVYDLRPKALEEDGLVGALQQRLNAVEQRSGIKVNLEVNGKEKLTPQEEVGLYRIAQEALNNALKHAAATMVTIRIDIGPDQLAMEVIDDGISFDPDSDNYKGGMGLSNMQERATKLGGTLRVVSSVGEGTKVLVNIKRDSSSH